jgi:hypothetical protein
MSEKDLSIKRKKLREMREREVEKVNISNLIYRTE